MYGQRQKRHRQGYNRECQDHIKIEHDRTEQNGMGESYSPKQEYIPNSHKARKTQEKRVKQIEEKKK
jgi:hypothetical protein